MMSKEIEVEDGFELMGELIRKGHYDFLSKESYSEDEKEVLQLRECLYLIINNNEPMRFSDLCKALIGLTDKQIKDEIKRIKKHPAICDCVVEKTVKTNSGMQKCTHITGDGVFIWIASIGQSKLTQEQRKKQNRLQFIMVGDYENAIKYSKCNLFYSERLIEEYIYNMREFFGITITERQKEYSFGRVDLLGINNKTNKITVIEIKHGVDNNVVNQCIKYKNGFSKDNIDVDIIIIQEDCSSIINDANKLDFKCYDYTETNNKLEFKCAN